MAKKSKEEAVSALLEGRLPTKRLKVKSCVPNTWNPNKMDAVAMEKLSNLVDEIGFILPIIVRPHPTKTRRYQIIDGFHRWSLFKEREEDRIDAVVIDVDKDTAMVLTNSLNYIRGQPDPETYASYYQELLSSDTMTLDKLSQYVPESSSEIEHILDNYNLEIEDIVLPDDVDVPAAPPDPIEDAFMEIRFAASKTATEVIDAEITRIAATLKGKNVRGRALEFMAVLSSQTPLECFDDYIVEETADGSTHVTPTTKDLKPRKKKRKRKSA
jgi:ParB/RepB/Spo0J family partition protein